MWHLGFPERTRTYSSVVSLPSSQRSTHLMTRTATVAYGFRSQAVFCSGRRHFPVALGLEACQISGSRARTRPRGQTQWHQTNVSSSPPAQRPKALVGLRRPKLADSAVL